MAQQIILPEHNSSRLLFVNESKLCDNAVDIPLLIRDTTSDSHHTSECNYDYKTPWLLGKLTPHVYYLEDTGMYDLNHEHTAEIYYIDPSTEQEVIMYNVTRVMEYGQECDRMYCEHSGGMKVMFIDSNESDKTANFYIKYEKNLPGCFETKVIDSSDPTKMGIGFIKKQGDNLGYVEVLGFTYQLRVTNDTTGEEVDYLTYITESINNCSCDFSKLHIDYHTTENNTNDIKVGILGITSNAKKFISYRISSNCQEPCYFLIQPPANRSWIFYRATEYKGRIPTYSYGIDVPSGSTYLSEISLPGSGATGMYGILEGSKYKYEIPISITEENNIFIFCLPTIFSNYSSIIVYGNETSESLNNPTVYYNDLDGMSYNIWYLTTETNKIIIEYNI